MQSRQAPVVLVCGADDSYAAPLAVTLFSALTNLDSEYKVELYLIDGGIRPENKKRLEHMLQAVETQVVLHWEQISPQRLDGLPDPWDHITSSAYLRLFIAEIVPEMRKKAIYLDSDLIAEGSISRLWNEPMDGAAALAAPGIGVPYVSSPKGVKSYKELGLRPEAPYFNSGVLVINLTRWREMNVSERALTYLREYREEVTDADQEALNVVLSEKWKPLDPSWNVYFTVGSDGRIKEPALGPDGPPDSPFIDEIRSRKKELIQNPKIRHYVGPRKPWRTDIADIHPDELQWMHYYWTSEWLTPGERFQSKLRFYTRRLRRFAFNNIWCRPNKW